MQFTAFPEAYDIHQWIVYSLTYTGFTLLNLVIENPIQVYLFFLEID